MEDRTISVLMLEETRKQPNVFMEERTVGGTPPTLEEPRKHITSYSTYNNQV